MRLRSNKEVILHLHTLIRTTGLQLRTTTLTKEQTRRNPQLHTSQMHTKTNPRSSTKRMQRS